MKKLQDFYQPAPPSWMPQTMGWYLVLAVLLLLLGWIGWLIWMRWRRDRYRRAALQELEHASAAEIPALLKRTALVAWPRETVASLSGERWLEFLEVHGDLGDLLLDLDYREVTLTGEEERAVRKGAGDWIRRHRVRA